MVVGTRLKDAPSDLGELAAVLAISPKGLVRLKAKHGDDLLDVLQHRWWDSRDRPRLLHRRSEHGYTDTGAQALPEEPEAVSDVAQAKISADARARFAELHGDEVVNRATDKAVERLRQLRAQARKQGVDMLPHLLRIEAELRNAELELAA